MIHRYISEPQAPGTNSLPPSVHLQAILQIKTHHERAAKQSKYPQSDVDISSRASGRCPSRQPLTSAGVTLTGHPVTLSYVFNLKRSKAEDYMMF